MKKKVIRNYFSQYYTEGYNNGFLNIEGARIARSCGFTIHWTCSCAGVMGVWHPDGHNSHTDEPCQCCGSEGHLAIIADVPRLNEHNCNINWERYRKAPFVCDCCSGRNPDCPDCRGTGYI